MNKVYKAVIFDVDGTLVPVDPQGIPSTRVVNAIHEAHGHAFIAMATGRPYEHAKSVVKMLNITNKSVFFGGAKIIDPVNNEVIWDKHLDPEQVHAISDIFDKYKDADSRVFFGDDDLDTIYRSVKPEGVCHGMSLVELPQDQIEMIANEINAISGVSGHIMESWHSGFNIDISHAEADKQHGVARLLEIYGIKKEEVIGVGDSSNDIPLFESVGLRVAMGNATKELKMLADYIAPTLQEDGAAHVIEKFILKK